MNWIDAKTQKPPINEADKIDVRLQVSVRVLVWIENYQPQIGSYSYLLDTWHCASHSAPQVSHFAIITNPIS